MDKKTTIVSTLFLMSIIILTGCIKDNSPDILYVDKFYDNNTPGWLVDHFNNIQDAIYAAGMNCSIYVNNGTYHENIVINSTISLIGEDANSTIIWGNGDIDDVIVIEQGNGVTVSGFTVTNSGRSEGTLHNEAGMRINADNNIINGNIFANNECGVYVINSDFNVISDNKFNNGYYGMIFDTSSDHSNVSNNIFLSNTIGFRIKGSQFNNVSKNFFVDNEGGVYLCCSSLHNIIFSNIFCNNSRWNAQDWCINQWDDGIRGNYWNDFHVESQGAYDDNNDGIVDKPYNISRGYNPKELPNKDYFPLIHPPVIKTTFYIGDIESCFQK